MAKIAVDLKQALAARALGGGPGRQVTHTLAHGDGWSVDDVLCTCGPQDHPFEERHSAFCIAVVAAGSFEYRSQSGAGSEVLTPGSLLLGNAERSFECRHSHGAGDRCLAFRYAPEYLERLASGISKSGAQFCAPRLPPLRRLAPLVARACAGLNRGSAAEWEELAIRLAANALQLAGSAARDSDSVPPGGVARVSRAAREIERHPDRDHMLASLAREARLSPYHFLRTFERVIGVTPHQYVLRARLREAALRLEAEPKRILDIAFDCGFQDISNFNRAFRAEFGVSPRAYRSARAR